MATGIRASTASVLASIRVTQSRCWPMLATHTLPKPIAIAAASPATDARLTPVVAAAATRIT
jgi:hypothetical protein